MKVNVIELGKKNKKETVKVIQLSGIQVSDSYKAKRLDKVIENINQAEADIIVFTGDLFDNYSLSANETDIITKLTAMKSKIGKYAVWGNHDYGGGVSRVYQRVMTAADYRVLKNEGDTLALANGKKLFIGGLDDSLLGNPSVKDTLSNRGEYDYSIVMTHEPDVADTQLVLAGHSHGGQIWRPFYQVTNVLAEKYVKDLYTIETGMDLYVSTGLGTTTIPARSGVIPEITVFKIHL